MTDTNASGGAAATPAMRRKADLMVGLFVGAVVAALGGVVVLATSGSAALGFGLLAVGVVAAVAAVVVLRSISPEERSRLVPPKADAEADGAAGGSADGSHRDV